MKQLQVAMWAVLAMLAMAFAGADAEEIMPGDSLECGQGLLECREPDDIFEEEDLDIAEALQRELARVGCYEGVIDGVWGPASIRALTNFNHWMAGTVPVNIPTDEALMQVGLAQGLVCGVD